MKDAGENKEDPVEVVFAILSDPHFAFEDGGTSHLKIKASGELASDNPAINPWAGLYDLINKQSLAASAILCPGDIAFRSNPDTLSAGWKHLNELGGRLKCEHVICATGNHDVSSRSIASKLKEDVITNLKAGYGPFEPLKCLTPPYPLVTLGSSNNIGGEDYRVRYFGAGLVLVIAEKYQVLIVNSCCEHGHDDIEFQRGTFPPSAVAELKIALAQCINDKVSVAIMHHPPEPHTQKGGGAHDFIDNGQELLQMLADQGDWLVIHGHKHEARLICASGNGFHPIVFGAASLAFNLEEISGTFKNQFYLLTVRLDSGRMTGRFQTWDWSQGRGWSEARPDGNGIYNGAAFGTRDVQKVITDIANLQATPMNWEEVIRKVPDADFLPPEARNQVRERLRNLHRLHIEVDNRDGQWVSLQKAAQ